MLARWWAYIRGLIYGGFIFGRTFGSKGGVYAKKFSIRCPIRETNNNI